MKMGFLTSLVLTLVCLNITPVFAEEKYYDLEIDDNAFNIRYNVDGDVIAMAIDKELTSLLIGLDNVNGGIFSIQLPEELISVEDGEFAVLANLVEIDYAIDIQSEGVILTFEIPPDTEEIEIIGTKVIPEFPGVLLAFALAITGFSLVTLTRLTRHVDLAR